MMRTMLLAAAAAAVACPALARNAPVRLVAEDPGGAAVVLSYAPGQPEALVIETVRAGVSGSVLTIRVDRATQPLLSLTFQEPVCRFEAESSRCRVALPPSPALQRLEAAFKAGRQARVTVETGGVMAMDRQVSLIGFTRALAASR